MLALSANDSRKVTSSEKLEKVKVSVQEHGICRTIVITGSSDGFHVIAGAWGAQAALELGWEKIQLYRNDYFGCYS